MARSIGQGTQFRPDTQAGVLAGNLPERVSKGGNPNAKNMGDVLAEAGQRMAQVEARRIEGVKRDARAQGRLDLGIISDQTMMQVQQELPGESDKWASRYDELFREKSAAVISKNNETLDEDKQWQLIQESIGAKTHSAIRKAVFAARGTEASADWSQYVADSGAAITAAMDAAGDMNFASVDDVVQAFNEHADDLIEEGLVSRTQIEKDRAAFMANVDKSHISRLLTGTDDANLLQAFADNYEYKSDALGHQEGLKAKIATRVGQLEVKNAERLSVLVSEGNALVSDIDAKLEMGSSVSDGDYAIAEQKLKEIAAHPKANKQSVQNSMMYLSAMKANRKEFADLLKISEEPTKIGPESVAKADVILAGVQAWARSSSKSAGDAKARNKILTKIERRVDSIKAAASHNQSEAERRQKLQFTTNFDAINNANDASGASGTSGVGPVIDSPEADPTRSGQIRSAFDNLVPVTPTQMEQKNALGREIMARERATAFNAAILSVDTVAGLDDAFKKLQDLARKGGFSGELAKHLPALSHRMNERKKLIASTMLLEAQKGGDVLEGVGDEQRRLALDTVLQSTEDGHGNRLDGTLQEYLFENFHKMIPSMGQTGAQKLQSIMLSAGVRAESIERDIIARTNIGMKGLDGNDEQFKESFRIASELYRPLGRSSDVSIPSGNKVQTIRGFYEKYRSLSPNQFSQLWQRRMNGEEIADETKTRPEATALILNDLSYKLDATVEELRGNTEIMNAVSAHMAVMEDDLDNWFWWSDEEDIVAEAVARQIGPNIGRSLFGPQKRLTPSPFDIDPVVDEFLFGSDTRLVINPVQNHFFEGVSEREQRRLITNDMMKFVPDALVDVFGKDKAKSALSDFKEALANGDVDLKYRGTSGNRPVYSINYIKDGMNVRVLDLYQPDDSDFIKEMNKRKAEQDAEVVKESDIQRDERGHKAKTQIIQDELPANGPGLAN